MFISAAARLDRDLKDLGIPIDGVSPHEGGNPNFVVSYKPEATAEQIAAGDSLAANYDTRTYTSRPLGVIASEIQALSSGDKQILADACTTFVNNSDERIDGMVKTLLAMGFNSGQQTVLKIGTAAALIRNDPRFAIRLGVDVNGEMPVA